MEFDHKIVSLACIRDDDTTYRITTEHASDVLHRSIGKIGLINPPVLQPQNDQYIVICGFGRIAACRALNWDEIPARCFLPQSSGLDRALVAIADNAAQRTLNIVEMARSFGLLGRAVKREEQQAPLQWLLSLGISVNAQLCKMLDAVCHMRPTMQKGLVDGTVALPTAMRLHAMEEAGAVDSLCRMFAELHLSLNRQREILDWIKGIAMREHIAIGAVLDCDPIAAWMDDAQMDRGRKAQLIREHLKRRRYPEIVRFEEKYQRTLKELNLEKGMRLDPPAHFEGQTFGLHLSFKDQHELAQLSLHIQQLCHSKEFSALLTPIK